MIDTGSQLGSARADIDRRSSDNGMRCLIDNNTFERFMVTNLVDLLQANASHAGDKQAFCFLRDHYGDTVSITYRALHERAMAIGGELQSLVAQGECAMLLFSPGLDFVAAFFGCLYAGVVAVPAAFPTRSRSASALEAIVNASNPAVILSTERDCELARKLCDGLPSMSRRPWIATDIVGNDSQRTWRDPQVDARQVAFLQFTSGSTSSPKGVVVSHENVLCNAALIQQAFGNTRDSRGVFWLPQYHDMGLIGGVIQPIYCGGSATLLAAGRVPAATGLVARNHLKDTSHGEWSSRLCL